MTDEGPAKHGPRENLNCGERERGKGFEISVFGFRFSCFSNHPCFLKAGFAHCIANPASQSCLIVLTMSSKNSGSVADAQCAHLYSNRKQIAILDFGSQYSHLIARRVRELNVFCELYSCTVGVKALQANQVIGIILSGGPSSVYDPDSPHVQKEVWDYIAANALPVMGICYGMQELAHVFGGEVSPSPSREYGRAHIAITEEHVEAADLIFKGVHTSQMWMSHGDKVTVMPTGFVKIAHTSSSEHAAIANPARKMFGLQFHPEVTHSLHGKEILSNFVIGVCNAPTDWNMTSIADQFVEDVRRTVGPTGHVIGAVSGGGKHPHPFALLVLICEQWTPRWLLCC